MVKYGFWTPLWLTPTLVHFIRPKFTYNTSLYTRETEIQRKRSREKKIHREKHIQREKRYRETNTEKKITRCVYTNSECQ